MDAPPRNNRLYFEAELRPHRSLSRKALTGVFAAMAAGSLIVTTLMYLLGAWPVIGFNGADLALAGMLFWLNARAARAREIIRLSDETLEIIRISANGLREQVELAPGWARTELEERPAAVPVLRVRIPGAVQEIGRQLGEAQKRDLAAALNRALARRRAPPVL